MNWNLENSYSMLPAVFFAWAHPTAVPAPQPLLLNTELAHSLGLDAETLFDPERIEFLAGNRSDFGSRPLAQAYAGHQFGHFTVLGDGRAHLLGELTAPSGQIMDIQLKGSGPTPYSRRGDGRAALGPMLREYLISEAMHALGIPTTRSLAVIATGEPVFRERPLPGAILTRIAASHIRVGTFEFAAAIDQGVEFPGHISSQQSHYSLASGSSPSPHVRALLDFTVARHYPELLEARQEDRPWELLQQLIDRQIALIVEWMRVGFIHGVMNTDNMTLSGETIDYGPCAFMDAYDPATVFSSIDRQGRYRFENQPRIAQWNLARFAETLLPLLDMHPEEAVQRVTSILNAFPQQFAAQWLDMLRRKIGLENAEAGDLELVNDLLHWMHRESRDYTNTFRDLSRRTGWENPVTVTEFPDETFNAWHQRWRDRLHRQSRSVESSLAHMRAYNPAIIPRNHRVEDALSDAMEAGDLEPVNALLEVITRPYDSALEDSEFRLPPRPEERVYQTFCGT